MFNRKVDMSRVVATSKMSLKISCLDACGNDVDRAERLYRYLSADIGALPDFDPVRPSGLQQIRAGADEVLGWIGAHKEDFANGLALLQSVRGKTPVTGLDPIPEL